MLAATFDYKTSEISSIMHQLTARLHLVGDGIGSVRYIKVSNLTDFFSQV